MIAAGCDIGSLTGKAVIISSEGILSSAVIPVKGHPSECAEAVMALAMKDAGITRDEIAYTVGTGYGRKNIHFIDGEESEISCHGRGAVWRNPEIRTIIDIGGQDAKAIKVDESGNVVQYVYNDKCASGTGRFLEIIADTLELSLDELGDVSALSEKKINLSNQCVVFAETEIISLINEGEKIPDIMQALHRAVAGRVASLAKSIVIEQKAAMTGGVARNAGMFTALESILGCDLVPLEDPQINGALGAALFALDRAGESLKKVRL